MAVQFEKFATFEEDMRIIQNLGDNPNSDDALSSQELKEKFDEAGLKLKAYLLQTIEQMNALVEGLNQQFEDTGEFLDGGTMQGNLDMNGNVLSGIPAPTEDNHAVNKKYADKMAEDAMTAAGNAQTAADNAQTAADSAQETADKALPKTGGDLTGATSAPRFNVKLDSWPTVYLQNTKGQNIGRVAVDTGVKSSTGLVNYRLTLGQQEAGAGGYEGYQLPDIVRGLTSSKFYEILTTKNPVTIAQGGTGAKTASDARDKLGIEVEVLSGADFNASTDVDYINQVKNYAVANAKKGVSVFYAGKKGASMGLTVYFKAPLGDGNYGVLVLYRTNPAGESRYFYGNDGTWTTV